MLKHRKKILLGMLILVVLAGITVMLPPVRDRLSIRMNNLRAQIYSELHPPEKLAFVPQDQVARVVQLTIQALTPIASSSKPSSSTLTPDAVKETSIPTLIPTPLPANVSLKGIRYMTQHFGWNECAPTNLAMALSFWGWPGKREDPVQYLKPYADDKNVMPYEMASYVQDKTDFAAIVRWGGTPQLVKSLLAAGYPVLVEQGVILPDGSTGKPSWMGHYLVVTGYDDASQMFTVQDSYLPNGNNYQLSYAQMVGDWRSFDDVFLMIYPKDKQNDLFNVLGSYADEASSDRIAIEIASKEISTFTGVNQFYAWFNRGTSLVHLQDYNGAATAYDEAYAIYATLPKDKNLPFRMTWYQTGPYYAYYFTGRYQDVVQLATLTLETTSQPYLEESYYWRARAEMALDDNQDATTDLRTSLKYHPGFSPSLDLMNQLGITN
jgi:hypothetical protein